MNLDLEPGRLEVARQRDLEVGDQLDAAALHLELNGEMSDEDPYAKTYANKKSSTRKLKKKQRVETKTKTKKRQRTGHGTLPIEGAGAAVRAQLAAAAEARAASTPVVRSDSLTSSRSPLAWFERTNIGDRNVLMPGPPSAPDFELTSLYAATLPEQKFTALVHSNGPGGPLVVCRSAAAWISGGFGIGRAGPRETSSKLSFRAASSSQVQVKSTRGQVNTFAGAVI